MRKVSQKKIKMYLSARSKNYTRKAQRTSFCKFKKRNLSDIKFRYSEKTTEFKEIFSLKFDVTQ